MGYHLLKFFGKINSYKFVPLVFAGINLIMVEGGYFLSSMTNIIQVWTLREQTF